MKYFLGILIIFNSSFLFAQIPCNNWLSTQTAGSSITVGDLDISGTQITVEAVFNRNNPYFGTYQYAGDLVSKHNLPSDVNYLLRPNSAEITTTNGYFITPPICNIVLNKTYHVALVYDGSTLKFYRNGFLMSQVPATGNLFLNNFITTIGDYSFGPPLGTNFRGYINEVRIWNVARTQTEIRTFINSSLPNPTTQVGLKGYYTFDNLINKQGNSLFNGTLNGSATISNTNPICTLVIDSCNQIVSPTNNIGGVINLYTPMTGLLPCLNKISVVDATGYNVGDTVLLIQMKGAVIDSTNTSLFGNITDYKNAGNFEFNYIKSKSGNVIELKNILLRQYDITFGKVQLIRVPFFTDVTVNTSLTCLPWDGEKGGVLVFNVNNTLTLNQNIDVSGKGFKGGLDPVTNPSTFLCAEMEYFYPPNADLASGKGEGISNISTSKSFGRGAHSNGGGGGNSHNSGGGGGGNGGSGGNGGYQFEGSPCGGSIVDNRGIAGNVLSYSNSEKKIFLGGAGGAGQSNNFQNFQALGGNGSGIVIISSNNIVSKGNKIVANGISGLPCGNSGIGCHEGMGGGGAGGVILLNIANYTDATICEFKGGKGGDMETANNLKVGPGGGGGGGILWITQNSLPSNITTINNGGLNGVCTSYSNDPYGANMGQVGKNLFGASIPISTISFKPNIDSVRIASTASSCVGFDFNGLCYTNTNPISTWQWSFGDGGTAIGHNTSHNYPFSNSYLVKLIITDVNGCKDSITTNVTLNTFSIDAGINQTFCGSQNNYQLNSTTQSAGPLTYKWSSNPATNISNISSSIPTALVNTNTTFYVTATNTLGCSATDSVKIFINVIPVVKTINDTSICKSAQLQLTTTPGLYSYQWTNGLFVSDSTISNPFFNDSLPRILIVTGSNGFCIAKDTITINIKPSPFVKSIPDTLICSNRNIILTTFGANNYSWSPNFFLNNYNASNPTFSGDSSIIYFVTGTGSNGCTAKDTVVVSVTKPKTIIAPPNKSFCTNSSVILNGNNGNTYTYNWSPYTYLSNSTIINPVANPPGNFTYNVNIKDRVCDYDSNFSVMVIANPLPILNATKSNDITCSITTAKLNVTGAIQYTWDPSSTLNNLFIPNPVANPVINTEYIVTGVDSNGCKGKDKITVLASLGNNTFNLPNAFTPNGDGKNDCFGLKGFGSSQKIYFIIYNRWGEKVFETNDINTCWNGQYKGHPVESGNYVYYITAKTNCGDIVRKGNVILIR